MAKKKVNPREVVVEKELDLKEFMDFGYLQEVNRQMLHPMGLSMFVETDDETGEATAIGIYDRRGEQEGTFFEGMPDREKGENIYQEFMARARFRKRLFKGHGPSQSLDIAVTAEDIAEFRKDNAPKSNVLNR